MTIPRWLWILLAWCPVQIAAILYWERLYCTYLFWYLAPSVIALYALAVIGWGRIK